MRLRRTAGAEDLRALAERVIHKTRTRKRVTPHNKYPLTHTRISNPNLNLNLNPNPSLNLPTLHAPTLHLRFRSLLCVSHIAPSTRLCVSLHSSLFSALKIFLPHFSACAFVSLSSQSKVGYDQFFP